MDRAEYSALDRAQVEALLQEPFQKELEKINACR